MYAGAMRWWVAIAAPTFFAAWATWDIVSWPFNPPWGVTVNVQGASLGLALVIGRALRHGRLRLPMRKSRDVAS